MNALIREARLLSGSGSVFSADGFGSHLFAVLGEARPADRRPYVNDEPDVLFTQGGWSTVTLDDAGAAGARFGRTQDTVPPRRPGNGSPTAAWFVTARS